MRAIVDEETCTGCGVCSDSCPEVFALDEDTDTAKVTPSRNQASRVDAGRSRQTGCSVYARRSLILPGLQEVTQKYRALR
ncbi:MAG: ferredoxin [Planctomycetes bacterium]|nr:ferredoxin [Planctomycetota bacterium]